MFYLYGHSMYVLHIAISWLWYIDIFGARAKHIRIMGMVRLGYQRDDQAKNIGSISSGLIRRSKEREKTQGPPEERNKKKAQHRKQEEKMWHPQKEEKKKEETQLSTQGPQEKRKEEKENSSTPSEVKKKVCKEKKKVKRRYLLNCITFISAVN